MGRNSVYSKLSKRNIMQQNAKCAKSFELNNFLQKTFPFRVCLMLPMLPGRAPSFCLCTQGYLGEKRQRSTHCCATTPWTVHSTGRQITEKTIKVTEECAKLCVPSESQMGKGGKSLETVQPACSLHSFVYENG